MKTESFPELDELIFHLTNINLDNYPMLMHQEIQNQIMVFGDVVDKKRIEHFAHLALDEIVFWNSVMN